MLLDEVFGCEHFRSEIIWHYRRWSNSRRGLLPAHQTILYYTKTDQFTFNETWTEYSPATNVDQILQRRSRDGSNKSIYDRDDNGNVVPNGGKRGVPLSDVWDIPFLNPKAKERSGYPTQKPLLLLERIIALATNEGDCILDPFCGSGTTLVAAQALGRLAIGIDSSKDAVALARKRLQDATRSRSRLVELGREAYRNSDGGVLSVLQGVDYVPVQRNAGIDAILKQDFEGGPVPVRIQRPGETPLDAAQKLAKASAGKGAKVMFLVVLRKAVVLASLTSFQTALWQLSPPRWVFANTWTVSRGCQASSITRAGNLFETCKRSRHRLNALFFTGPLNSDCRPATTSSVIDELARRRLVGQLVQDVEHHFLDDRPQAAGADVLLVGLVGDQFQGAVGEIHLGVLHGEQGLVLLDQGVLGLGQDADQGPFVQRTQGRHHRQTADELGDHAELQDVVAGDAGQQIARLQFVVHASAPGRNRSIACPAACR